VPAISLESNNKNDKDVLNLESNTTSVERRIPY
jgi:hypothetical protein